MFTGFHWFDLVIPFVMLALLASGLVILGRAIGSGYARAHHELEQRPDEP